MTYTLTGTDASSFDIDATTGQITVGSGTMLDFETKTSYSVTVGASDGGNDVSIAVTIDVIDEDEPPDAPGAPTVTADGPSGLTVTWTAPANAGRPDITDYGVRYRIKDSGAEFTDAGYDGTDTTRTITGLDSDTEYEVQVRARNAEGESDWSSPGMGSTDQPGDGPDECTILGESAGNPTVYMDALPPIAREGNSWPFFYLRRAGGDFSQPLTVQVRLTMTGGTERLVDERLKNAEDGIVVCVSFMSDRDVACLYIEYRNDNVDEEDTTITARLLPGDWYTVGEHIRDPTMVIQDDD